MIRRSLALQETASYLSSSIEQIYLSLNHTSILSCTFTNNLRFSPFDRWLRLHRRMLLCKRLGSESGSSQVLDVTVKLVGTDISTYHFGHAGAKRQMGKLDIHEQLVICLHNRPEISRSNYPAFVRNINGDKICQAYL